MIIIKGNMDEIREKCVSYFKSYLNEEEAYNLEEQIFQETRDEFYYKQLARCYLNAFKNKTWSYDGYICSAFELNKNRWIPFQEAEQTMEIKSAEQLKPASTSIYTCGKCKKNECTYYEQQTRSADEGTTLFITCLHCGHKWKN